MDTKAVFAGVSGITGVVLLGYFTGQADFTQIALGYALLWITCIWAVSSKLSLRYLIPMALLLRAILVPSLPPLSDDFYRFIWDGYLTVAGESPFEAKPEWLMEQGHSFVGQTTELYEKLNSKIYHTVYPPISQSVFALAVSLFPKSEWGAVFVMKLILLACEWGSIDIIRRILKHLKRNERQVLWYAFNPLVIVEICGNLHFEGMMVFFLLMALYFMLKACALPNWTNGHWLALSAVAMGMAIGVKILPLMLLPFLWWKIGWWRAILYGLITASVTLLAFAPVLQSLDFIMNFLDSIRLYYGSFEFNGSLYYLAREIGFSFRGYNEIGYIGPGLATFAGLSIIIVALWDKNKGLERLPLLFLFAFTIYQLCATTVHPWYIVPLVALASLTHFRFPMLWSALIILTYVNYSYQAYHENLWVVIVEYILLFSFILWEIKNKIYHRLQENNID